MRANIVTLVLAVVALACVSVIFAGRPWNAMRIAGAAIAVPSLALFVLARIQLGGSFAIRPKARALVTHGIYSRIRNPIYVFSALLLAGFLLYMEVPRFLLILVFLIPLQVYRAGKESKVLEAKFGDAYREYKARTWF